MARLNSVTDEELLKIAEASKEEEILFKNTGVVRYIQKFNIKPGNTFIPNYIIYYHYRKSRKELKYIPKIEFFRQFTHFFEKGRKKNEYGYFLDETPFDLSIKGYFAARAFLRKEKNAKKEKKKSKS